MNYLEVKYDVMSGNKIDKTDFISDVIENQKILGLKKDERKFIKDKLIDLGFTYNSTTNGFFLIKKFTIDELKSLALEIDKLENHTLTHGYINLKIHNNTLYFWDTALIFENVDTFEYCLEHHNLFDLGNVHIITKSNSINEDLLNLANYTKRYTQPSLEFITQGYFWDNKMGCKIQKYLIPNINEYLPNNEVIKF